MTINTQAFATVLANASLMCSVLCVRQARQCGRDLTSGCFRFRVFVSRVSCGIRMCMHVSGVCFSAWMKSRTFSVPTFGLQIRRVCTCAFTMIDGWTSFRLRL